MSSFFDKLNLLLRSSVNTILSSGQSDPHNPSLMPQEAERQIVHLRKQIDAALDEEEAMQTRLDKMVEQVRQYDEAADRALQSGTEEEARRLIQQMQQHRRAMQAFSADLEQHRVATSEFIERVNILEATISEAKTAQELTPDQAADGTAASVAPAARSTPPKIRIPINTDSGTTEAEALTGPSGEVATAPRPSKISIPITSEASQPEPPVADKEQAVPAAPEPDTSIRVQVNPPTLPVPQAAEEADKQPAQPPVWNKLDPDRTLKKAEASLQKAGETLNDVVRNVRDKLETAITPIVPKPVDQATPVDETDEEDLQRRRARLSKPD